MRRPLQRALVWPIALCAVLALARVPAVQADPAAEAAASTEPTGVTCDSLSVTLSDDKTQHIFHIAAGGDISQITGFAVDFGDHQSFTVHLAADDTADRSSAAIPHIYRDAGNHIATAHVLTTASGKAAKVTSPSCRTSVAILAVGAVLPDTGAPSPLALMATAGLLGIVVYQLQLRWRRPRQPSHQ